MTSDPRYVFPKKLGIASSSTDFRNLNISERTLSPIIIPQREDVLFDTVYPELISVSQNEMFLLLQT